MSDADKQLTVRSFIAHEQAKRSKRQSARNYSRSVETYVAEIDARYRRGDRRPVAEIWPELADK